MTTLAGTAGLRGIADGTGAAARFNDPEGVAVDSAGNVYVADRTNNTIHKITAAGVVTTLAGTGGLFGSADGTGAAARFAQPFRVAVESAGNVYVADTTNHTIRKVTAPGVVTTLAGTAGMVGSVDGTGAAARFFYPVGVAVDSAGNIYVGDSHNNNIRKVTGQTRTRFRWRNATGGGWTTRGLPRRARPGGRVGANVAGSYMPRSPEPTRPEKRGRNLRESEIQSGATHDYQGVLGRVR